MPRFLPRRLLLTLGSAALYLATFDADPGAPDENQRLRLAEEVATRGLAGLAHSGELSRYPPLLSIVAALPVKLGMWLDAGHDPLWTKRMAVAVSLAACVALIPMFFAMARALGLSERLATFASLLFAITNPIWPYSKRFFSEPLSAALALGAFAGVFIFLRSSRRIPLVAGLVCVALLPLNNFFMPVAVTAGLIALTAIERRWTVLALVVFAAGVGGLLTLGGIYVRFGGLTSAGYARERFTFAVVDAFHGLLFGWGRSIFLYAPMTLLGLFGWRRLARKELGLVAGALLATAICLGIVSCWWCWYGGVCWGPRLVIPILPILSLGALPLFEQPRRLTKLAAGLVAAWGLWVQFLGTSFSQDYAIYFWMNDDYSNERLAWFDFNHSQLVLLPHHFLDHPWAMSNIFLRRVPTGPSTIAIDHKPVQEVQITHRGDDQYYFWTITDIFAVVQEGGGERRVPAGQLGARLTTYNHADGSGALDGDPRTHWTSGQKRHDGMSVLLAFDKVHTEIVRLEVEHAPAEHDFPSGLEATIRVGSDVTNAPAHAARPRLDFHPALWVLLALAVLLFLGAALPREQREEEKLEARA